MNRESSQQGALSIGMIIMYFGAWVMQTRPTLVYFLSLFSGITSGVPKLCYHRFFTAHSGPYTSNPRLMMEAPRPSSILEVQQLCPVVFAHDTACMSSGQYCRSGVGPTVQSLYGSFMSSQNMALLSIIVTAAHMLSPPSP